MITVAIVEDIKDIREPLKEFLSEQEEFLCQTAEESVEAFFDNYNKELPPDVILLDIGLPGISGLAAISLIKEQLPDSEIIMLTVHEEHDKIFSALKAGASGYLIKSTPLLKIKEAIMDVNKGGAPMSPPIARKVIKFFDVEEVNNKESLLTKKEEKIVHYIVDGLNYKMIAANLNVTIDAIKYHLKNIYKKLQINSKGELIAKSIRGEI